MKRLVLLISFVLLSWSLTAQSVVTGYVFRDINDNGKMEQGEKGIAGVAVSNGHDVVLTDQKGKYLLPVGLDDIISVIKPSGYKVTVNKNFLPQFFYIHKPLGSPPLRFKGVEPTGKLPDSVNFALVKAEEKDEFTALIFGDPQPRTEEEVGYFTRGVVSEVQGIKNVAFGLTLGDLVGNVGLMDSYIDAVKKVGIPWYNVIGNHDINFDVTADSLSDETFEAHFGPATYAFNYAKTHFIILDDVLYPDPRNGSRSYLGGLRKDQLAFIENDLKFVDKEYLIVLAFHIPLAGAGFRAEDRNKLFDLLKDFPHTLSLSAHTHIQRQDFFTKADGWKQDRPHHEYNVGTTCGDWYNGKFDEKGIPIATMRDGTPKGYSFIHFTRNNYVIDYKVVGRSPDYQLELFVPKVVVKDPFDHNAGIYVNFFMGSEKDAVSFRVDNGAWKSMTYKREYDPEFYHTMQEWDYAEEQMKGKRPSNAIVSTHLWRANIPNNLEIGEHTIEVKATDMYGRTFRGQNSYKIEKRK